ncbi:hypothetical protein KKB44_06625 [Candidatus Micrarchaeota archaeon]|nr:hypothetical protein [Candidatus Micrarchaeota archaeon]
MFHVGTIVEVINPKSKGIVSADDSIQAVVRMWDNNLLILEVDKKIGRKIKKKDYVLCDYMPMSPESRHRNLRITKVLSNEQGKKIWGEFQGEVERRKNIMKQMKPYAPYIR